MSAFETGVQGEQYRPLVPGAAPPPLANAAALPELADHGPTDEEEQFPPPPPPTQLFVDRPPELPKAIIVETHSMSVQWSPCSVTVASNEPRVVEYLLTYELQMQQLEGDSSPEATPIDGTRWSVQYMGPATYVQVRGLRPGRRYAVRVVCQPVVTDETVVVNLAPPSEVLLVSTPPTPPEAPAPPVLASRARNTLKFKWQEPEETGGRPILHYVLEMVPPPLDWDGPQNAEGWYTVYGGPERSVLVKRLQPGHRYAARVKAISCMGESPYSGAFATSTQAAVPSTPAAPLVVGASEDSVTLQWEAPADNGAEISGYSLEVDDGRGDGFRPLSHGQASEFRATGLQSGVVYRFRVRAENEVGRSQWSPVCEAITAATKPSPPPAPTVLGSNQSSVSIAWKDVENDGGSPVVGYEVEMQPKCKAAKRGMSDDWLLVYQGENKACTLAGLRAGCTYRVRVRAFNVRGPGNFNMPTDIYTAPDVPDPPASLAPTARHPSSITMAWGKPEHDGGSAVSSYRLEMSLVGRLEDTAGAAGPGRAHQFEAVYVGPETSAEAGGLDPGSRYQFQVLAINKQGASPWSQPVTVDTRPGLPLPPDPPEVSAATSSSLHLTWVAPYGQGSPVNSYVLQLCRLQALQQAAAALAAPSAPPQQLPQGEPGEAQQAQQAQQHAGPLALGVPLPGTASAAAAPTGPPTPGSGGEAHADAAAAAGGDGAAALTGSAQCLLPVSEARSQAEVGDAMFQAAYHGSELSCTVKGLEPDTEYAFRLRSCNAVGASAWSPVEVFRTAPAPPTVPLGLMLEEVSSSSAGLSWQPPELDQGSPLTGYQLEYAPALRGTRAQAAHWKNGYHGQSTHCTVERLCPGREYQVRVRAGNNCGWGPWTQPITLATHPGLPEAPEAPTFSNRMGTSVRVKWAAPAEDNGSPVTEYVLEMAPPGGSFQAVYAGESTSFKAPHLEPGSKYRFRVRAANAVGSGACSPEAAVSTTRAPPSPPSSVDAVVAVAGGDAAPSVLVSWQSAAQGELQAACISYEIDAAPAPAAAAPVSGRAAEATGLHKPLAAAPVRQTCSAKVCQHTLVGLQPGTAYLVRIRGIGADGAGHGDWSEAAAVQLPAAERSLHSAGAGSAEEDNGAARSRHRKSKSSSGTGEGHAAAKAHRAHSLGTKTVAAKAKPKKTWLTPFATMLGLSERELRRFVMYAGIFLVAVMVLGFFLSWSLSR